MVKTSEIYADIADIYARPIDGGPKLMVWTWMQVGVMTKSRNFDQLERMVKLEPVVVAGIAALRDSLERELGQSLPLEYEEFVLYGAKCEPLKLDLSDAERYRALERVLMTVAEAMHDAWVEAHLGDFGYSTGISGEQRLKDIQFKRLFVPFPLLGWKVGRRYGRMAVRLLNETDLPLMGERMQRIYEYRTREFCKQHEITNVEILQKKLMDGSNFYRALSGDTEKKLARTQSTQSVARAIMREIVAID